ncbi:hypothetical protein CTEN210_03518 [Chaetoceros tenuissimus]|uniref:Leucine-rich repeat domain-containing protein n=1 Tax=Chaetoceros tenuissimus TaxID=426638 RepID=A0AAD3H1V6_9STRA|nr:hypothetical protein CTEN210_03518 [Chaetoceros tenuissimus]
MERFFGINEEGEPLIYDERERDSWQVVMVLPGVEVIPDNTFNGCFSLETVIMSETVRRIEDDAFAQCFYLKFVKLPRNLESIGWRAFWSCESLTSVFIPPSCRFIGREAFCDCKQLLILSISQNIRVGGLVFQNTALIGLFQLKLIKIVRMIETMMRKQSNGSNLSIMKMHTLFTALAPLTIL